MSLITELEKRRGVLQTDRTAIVPHWQELQRYINPLLGRFFGEKPNRGAPDLDSIIKATSVQAVTILAAGMQSGLTNPSRQWFKLTTHNPDTISRDVKMWLDEVHSRMLTVMSSSNFYRALHGAYEEIGTFGTAALVIEEDFNDVIRCKTFTAGTYCLGLGARDDIDTMYQDLWATAWQIAGRFEEKNCSDKIKNALRNNHDTLFEIRHAIEPDPTRHHRFRSVWWELGAETPLRESWYDIFPVMSPRWQVKAGDTYGFGPGTKALPEVKMLQKMASMRLTGINKQVEPPLVVPDNMVGKKINNYPNGVTYAPTGTGGTDSSIIRPLYGVQLSLNDLNSTMLETVNDINKIMHVDLFLMLHAQDNSRQMTAREVIERHEEKMLALGPVLERLENELLTPAIEQIFNIMFDSGLIPPVPEGLSGGDLKIEYVSVLSQAQRMMGLAPIQDMVTFGGSLAGIAPEVMDNIDWDETLRTYGDLLGVPAKMLRDAEDVAKTREARAQQQAQQEEAAMMQQIAQTGAQAAQGAKTLSEADLNTDNALQALLGANAAGAGDM